MVSANAWRSIAIAIAALAGCGQPAAVATPVVPVLLQSCRVPDVPEPLRCGTLDVPEDHARPRGRRLRLPVVVVPATGRTRSDRGIPLFVLLGGPGASATAMAPDFATSLGKLRQVGDVVLIDQRGTGTGPSSLACAELDDVPSSTAPFAPGAVHACRARLETRYDLRSYTTTDAARDLEAARQALGYDTINLEATSYGTRLAQVYLRLYPERVNAVVLFGTLAMDVHLPSEFAENAQRVVDMIVDDCARDPACAEAFPDLRRKLAELETRLPDGINRTALTESVRHLIYSATAARTLPRLIARVAAGDASALDRPRGGPPSFRNAVLLSVSCSEDEPAIDHATALASANATWFGAGRLVSQSAACAEWPRAVVPPGFYDPVSSDVPVLAIAGGRDPVTPVDYAVRATARMPRAQIVVVPSMAHEIDDASGPDCLLDLELAFLRDPSAPVDASCIAANTPPPFDVAR